MKPRAVILALALGLGLACSGLPHAVAVECPPTATAPTAERIQEGLRRAADRGFLWRIDKDSRSSFLFGTVHAAKFDWMFPGPSVRDALLASDTVALELDMLDPEIQRGLAAAMAALQAPPMRPEFTEKLLRLARAACVDEVTLARLNAPMQVMTLAVLAARNDGLDPAYGVDLFLAGFARGAGKPVVSLETPELQMQALFGGDPAQVQALMEEGMAELEQGRAAPRLRHLAQVWAQADHDRLLHYEDWCDCIGSEADRALLRRLLDGRNPGLAQRIADLHASGQRVFAAVGSLHMTGPLALPELLRQLGFNVERVIYPR